MIDDYEREEGNEEVWKQVMVAGHPLLIRKKKWFGMLPGEPRCKLCIAPFDGIGGWVVRRGGVLQSKRNPNFCNACDSFLAVYPGGVESPMTLMFADLRNSVGLSSEISPKEFMQKIALLRNAALQAMAKSDGSVLEYIGDGVVAVWPPGIAGPDHAKKALRAAEILLDLARDLSNDGDEIPLGIGVHTGTTYIGTIASASNDLQEITAFGYDVNLTARLSAEAKPGQALISQAACEAAGVSGSRGEMNEYQLKGIDNPTQAMAIS